MNFSSNASDNSFGPQLPAVSGSNSSEPSNLVTPAANYLPNRRIKYCIIYTRVSTDEQASEQHNSLKAQEEYCLGEIAKRAGDGWAHLKTISDPGYSGNSFDRPGFMELMKYVRAKKVQFVLVYRRDRLFRNQDLAVKTQGIFDANGVRVLSYVEGMHDDSPHAVFVRGILDGIAELERANIRKRAYDCRLYAAKRGDWKGGNPPFGYKLATGQKTLAIEERESKIVRYVFERVADGIPVTDVVRELRAMDAFGRRRKRRIHRDRKSKEI